MLLSFTKMSSRFTHVVACNTLFPFMPSSIPLDEFLLIHSLVDEHLGFFCLLAILNNAAVNKQ